jgi:Arc/MetJ-type ribon-helix-helix transcriptional regulator
MNLALDAASEALIQRELDRGHFTSPAEVVARALELLNSQEDWFDRNRDAIAERLESSFAQIDRGEGISGDDARELLARRRAERNQRSA